MAFYTGWAGKIGAAVRGVFPGLTGILLSKSDGSADLWQSDGSGAAKVAVAGGTNAALTALSDGAVLSAAPIEYKRVTVAVDAGASGWVQLHDAAAIPADGAVPIVSEYVTGPDSVSFEAVKVSTGLYWCISSTMRTKTITAFSLACAGVES